MTFDARSSSIGRATTTPAWGLVADLEPHYSAEIRSTFAIAVSVAALIVAPTAVADDWLPHPADATWTYEWTDSVYNPTPTKELVTVKEQRANTFTLAWTTLDQGNPPEAPLSVGTISFQETAAGFLNTDWSSNPPPPSFPILCAALFACNNSLASTYYNVIWGSRAPVLGAPLLQGASWSSTGGSGTCSVSSTTTRASWRLPSCRANGACRLPEQWSRPRLLRPRSDRQSLRIGPAPCARACAGRSPRPLSAAYCGPRRYGRLPSGHELGVPDPDSGFAIAEHLVRDDQ